MNGIPFQLNKKIILLVLAFVAVISSATLSIAHFTDRANRTTTVRTASFDAEGYTMERTVPEGYVTSGETVEVTLTERNQKSEDITSQVTMTVGWDSPVLNSTPWDSSSIPITLDGEDVSYTVNTEDNTISFALPKRTLSAGTTGLESTLSFGIPSDLSATGTLSFEFDQIALSAGEWTYECTKDTLSSLNYSLDVAWNISADQTTALGNKNRDVIALLESGASTQEYTLNIIKNGSDANTNYGRMMNWAAADQTPWAACNITELNLPDDLTTIGCYAFAGETGITTLSLPNTVNTIGISAFQGSGLNGTLTIPATVQIIESLAFGNLPDVNTITFEHGSDDTLILPDNTSEGEETSGAFYVPDFIKTTFEFNGNTTAEDYNWVADNRLKVGISEILLSYSSLQKGGTAEPILVFAPENYDAYQSIQYEITSGDDYATIDADTGVLTGTAVGTVTVQATIVDANGDTVQATYDVSVQAVAITSATLSYEDVAVGSTVNPTLTIDPTDADVVSKTYEITSGSSYATIDASTGALTGTGNGVAVVKVTIVDGTGATAEASTVVTVGTPAAGTRYVWQTYNLATEYSMPSGCYYSTGLANFDAITDDWVIEHGNTYTGIYPTQETEIKIIQNININPDGELLSYDVYKTYTLSTTATSWTTLFTIPTGSGYSWLTPPEYWFWFKGDSPVLNGNLYTGTAECLPMSEPNSCNYNDTFQLKYKYLDGKFYLVVTGTSDEDGERLLCGSKTNYTKPGGLERVNVKGTTNYGYTSASSASSYPANSYSGSYWYVYQGTDCIDADAVTYSASSVTAGEEITVNVTPSTKNVYGGTISYRYEYSTDGGSTWTAAGTTTKTSYAITAPEDANTFLARVRANDNWGFTSSVYVYADSVTVVPPVIIIKSAPSQSGTLTYTGSAQTPTWSDYDSSQLTIGGVTEATNAGSYSATFTPKSGYAWSDGTTTAKTVNWTINKTEGSVSLSSESVTVTRGKTKTITVTRDGNGTISAKSSDTSVATVSVSGTTVTIKGVVTGTATITVSVAEGTNHTAPSDAEVLATVTAVPVSSATLSYANVAVGSTVSPTLTIDPSDADITSKTYEITSGSSYATVDASTGVLTGTGNGVAVVKVTIVDKTGKETVASCTVTCGTLAVGTRYVWEKFNRVTVYEIISSELEDGDDTFLYSTSDKRIDYNDYSTIYYAIYGTAAYDTSTGKWNLSNYIDGGTAGYHEDIHVNDDEYLVVSTTEFGTTTSSERIYCGYPNYGTSGWIGQHDRDYDDASYGYYRICGNFTTYRSVIPETSDPYGKGSVSYGYISNADSDAYPADNYSGSYWYVYQGTDCIDADAVTYSANSVTAGETVTVNVTASTKNVYGGTISYQYEYSADNGATWTTVGTSTETSYTITVPEDADSFMARVKANDDWGFASSVYVYGNSVTVIPPPTPVSDLPAGSSVYLNVDGEPKEFLVVNQGNPDSTLYDGSCDGTWLLMKDIYSKRVWDSSDNNYASSNIHTWLNKTFIGKLDSNVQSTIKQVKLPYRNGTGAGSDDTIASGADGLSAKVFLLSCYEVGWTTSHIQNVDGPATRVDGAKLKYFSSGTGTGANNKRIGYYNDTATRWWLRSVYVSNATATWGVETDGSHSSKACDDSYGIRPALILPSDCTVDADGFISVP